MPRQLGRFGGAGLGLPVDVTRASRAPGAPPAEDAGGGAAPRGLQASPSAPSRAPPRLGATAALAAAAAAATRRRAAARRRRRRGVRTYAVSAETPVKTETTMDNDTKSGRENAALFIIPEVDAFSRPATEIQVGRLITWARSQSEDVMLHPGVAARGQYLSTSVAVPEGTPLIGVRSAAFLGEVPQRGARAPGDSQAAVIEVGADGSAMDAAEAECRRLMASLTEPAQWPLRLAVRLLKEHNDRVSPWEDYIGCMALRPAAPLLWSAAQANELQYRRVKLELLEQLSTLHDFYGKFLRDGTALGREDVTLGTLARFVGLAMAGGCELSPGEWALVPLVDLVGPPEGPAADRVLWGHRPPKATCNLTVEQDGDDGSVVVISAARALKPGDVLTRDHGLSDDDLLLRHGLATKDSPRGEVQGVLRVPGSGHEKWQMQAIGTVLRQRAAAERSDAGQLVSGDDLEMEASVRRAETIPKAIDRSLMYACRVLVCDSQQEVHSLGEWAGDFKGNRGMRGLKPIKRSEMIATIARVVDGFVQQFVTTAAADSNMVEVLSGNQRVALAYRLEKKRILEDVLDLCGKAAKKETLRERNRGLPSAVTGESSRSKASVGFSSGTQEARPRSSKAAKFRAKVVTKGAVVQVLVGKYAGQQGTAITDQTGMGTVALKMKLDGRELDDMQVQHLRIIKEGRPQPLAAPAGPAVRAAPRRRPPAAAPARKTVGAASSAPPRASRPSVLARTPAEAAALAAGGAAAEARAPAAEAELAPAAPARKTVPQTPAESGAAPAAPWASAGAAAASPAVQKAPAMAEAASAEPETQAAPGAADVEAVPVAPTAQAASTAADAEPAPAAAASQAPPAAPVAEAATSARVDPAAPAAQAEAATAAAAVQAAPAMMEAQATVGPDLVSRDEERDKLRRAMRAMNVDEHVIDKVFRIADEL